MESEINSLLDQWCQYDLILKPKNVEEKYLIDTLFETNKDFEIRCKGIDSKFDADTHERVIECNRATISKRYTFEHPQINQAPENNNKYISIGFNPITKQIEDINFFNNENNTYSSLIHTGKMNLNRLVQKEIDKSINADKINNSLSSFNELLRIFQNDTKKRLNMEIKNRDLDNFFTNFSDLMRLIKNNKNVEKSIEDCSEIYLNNMDSFYDLMLMLHDANKIENKNLVKFKQLKL